MVWAEAEAQSAGEAARGVTDWYAGGVVVTCRWLAGAIVADSLTDVDGSRAAGIACIGYANKTGEDRLLAVADVQVDDMQVLADHLSTLARRNAG